MKITFEGDLAHIIEEMKTLLDGHSDEFEFVDPRTAKAAQGPGPEAVTAKAPVDSHVANPVEKPLDKSKKPERTEKQKANDEKLRERALAKKAAGLKVGDKAAWVPPVEKPVEKPLPPPPATAESLGLAPADVVNIRQKTILDLQEAYANGKQQEVFGLLSRFGNGAKSFRELPPDAFVPIREAIDSGALT